MLERYQPIHILNRLQIYQNSFCLDTPSSTCSRGFVNNCNTHFGSISSTTNNEIGKLLNLQLYVAVGDLFQIRRSWRLMN